MELHKIDNISASISEINYVLSLYLPLSVRVTLGKEKLRLMNKLGK